jgi:hypothetical protein
LLLIVFIFYQEQRSQKTKRICSGADGEESTSKTTGEVSGASTVRKFQMMLLNDWQLL